MSNPRDYLIEDRDSIDSCRSLDRHIFTSDAARPYYTTRRFGLVEEYERDYEMSPRTFEVMMDHDHRNSFDNFLSDHVSGMSVDCQDGLDSEDSEQTCCRLDDCLCVWTAFWVANRGIVLMVVAMFFGAIMSVTTRLLELRSYGREGMQPLQILFSRMLLTAIFSTVYLQYKDIPDHVLGAKDVRLALVVRGLSGTLGVYGLYYSLQYLPLAEASVITFLAPLAGAWLSSYMLGEAWVVQEMLAGLVSLAGVVLIAQPNSMFSPPEESAPYTIPVCADEKDILQPAEDGICFLVPGLDPNPAQRLSAVLVALVGVIGAAVAYCSLRYIGKRAHPLITVNYLAVISTAICGAILLSIPQTGFQIPADIRQWINLFLQSICGFITQFLQAMGFQYEQSNRMANMFYTQLLFALMFDKIIWDVSPDLLSIIGGLLVLASVLYVALRPKSAGLKTSDDGGRNV